MAAGILAYGSLVDDPGDELATVIAHRVDGMWTPFPVEFARSSRSRDGGPTLVPVSAGGSPVRATIFVLDPAIDEATVRRILWRRETRRPDGEPEPDAPWIASLAEFGGARPCLYTALAPNIGDLSPRRLAELAVLSALGEAGRLRRDGLSYLDAQLRRGTVTPLSRPYADAIRRLTGAQHLDEAWRIVRDDRDRFRSLVTT